jgi:hypothetical protein
MDEVLIETKFPPSPQLGQTLTEHGRQWRYVAIVHGAPGGRFVYYTPDAKKGLNLNYVVIDQFLNKGAFHFAGVLSKPWNGTSEADWILIKPLPEGLQGPTLSSLPHIEELEAEDGERYERNDVDRQRRGPMANQT